MVFRKDKAPRLEECSWSGARSRACTFEHIVRFSGLSGRGGGGGGIRTSFILRPCPKHWYLQRFRLFVQHTAGGYATRQFVTSVHVFRDHAQHWYLQLFLPKTQVFAAFSPLYNILHKDVEQENRSQASMPFATMPKMLVVTACFAQNTGIYQTATPKLLQ